MSNEQAQNETDFGYRDIPRHEKQARVKGVFDSVASSYDIMNDLMSLGAHRMWKRRMVQELRPFAGAKLLDLAGGTGDISFRFLDSAKKSGVEAHATITDINEEMLKEGRKRALDSNRLKGIDWHVVNAEEIPFPDNSFDYVTISFGIRNVTDRDKALREITRVLKPGGKFVCMEFSHVDNAVFKKLYDAYSFKVIPAVGEWVAKDRDAYQYLVESIRRFPTRQQFAGMMQKAGLVRVKFAILSQGAVAIHTGWKV